MPPEFSTGSSDLDRLLEELRIGDNVVFYTVDAEAYLPFVAAVAQHRSQAGQSLLYVRSEGSLDATMTQLPGVRVIDLAETLTDVSEPVAHLHDVLAAHGRYAFYVFEALSTLRPWFPNASDLQALFLHICPSLYRMGSVVYWGIVADSLPSAEIAAIKDCTQVFLQVERSSGDLLITPAKVWGRFSPAMFRTHRVHLSDQGLLLGPAPASRGDPGAYAEALADKNRELADIRDALDRSNRALQQRNRELEELNARLAEQGRLYASLRTNLDQLLRLVQAGQAIGSTLVLDHVQDSLLAAAQRLFDAPACRLSLRLTDHAETVRVSAGLTDAWRDALDQAKAVEMVASACQSLAPASMPLTTGEPTGSLAVAPIVLRDKCLGSLEIAAPDGRLATHEGLTLLTYLASQASLSLDNALLYQEVETQGEQLRSYVENVITTEEQESRRLALDLHDGLVQMIVASYQHLQTAQAWRSRDPETEEREIQQGIQLLRRAIHEARRLITQLRPAGLDDLGLVHALRLYVAQLTTDADWHVALDVADDWTPLPGPLEAAIFRIVQEATTNALKYSQAPEVEVCLWRDARDLCVAITDCGVGFDPNRIPTQPDQGTHMGLVGIRERARLWGGRCTITSQPGVGTRVQVSIPLTRAATSTEATDG